MNSTIRGSIVEHRPSLLGVNSRKNQRPRARPVEFYTMVTIAIAEAAAELGPQAPSRLRQKPWFGEWQLDRDNAARP